MLRLSCYPCCLSPLNRFLTNMIWHILFYLYWRWVWDFDMMFKDMGLVIRVMCLMIRFVVWILMGSVRGWFLDDRITGNAWFLLVKWGDVGVLFWIICIDFLKILSEFEERLILLGFDGILKVFLMIFSDAEIAKNIDFSRFCRTHYRTRKR